MAISTLKSVFGDSPISHLPEAQAAKITNDNKMFGYFIQGIIVLGLISGAYIAGKKIERARNEKKAEMEKEKQKKIEKELAKEKELKREKLAEIPDLDDNYISKYD